MFFVGLFLVGCNQQESIEFNNRVDSADSKNQLTVLFEDKFNQSGINFKHKNGMSGELYYFEIMGAATALFDYDNDGDLDVYLGQGGLFNQKTREDSGRLYRNDLSNGNLKFTDVTTQSGLISFEYSMGVAIGDINNDGYVDVYLSNYGLNQMFLNEGDGTFKDVTETSNTYDDLFSSSSAFVDIDNDGDLDLYVVNYLDFNDKSNSKACKNNMGVADYCGPGSYNGIKDKLFENLGNGVFSDISVKAGIDTIGAGLGVVTADFNGDGFNDIYVTNDMMHNFMWINNQDNTFTNSALLRGNAVNFHGNAEASMGVDAGDIDNDGDLDLFMTHLLNETNTIYINNGDGYFNDETTSTGLAEPSKGHTGFGTAFLDYDNDGWLDIIIANGAVRINSEQIEKGIKLPLNQPNQLFHNVFGKFQETSKLVEDLLIENVSRGLAVGDIDNDGDSDVLITNVNDYPQMLINKVGNLNNWIGFNLVDDKGRYLIGSSISLELSDGTKVKRISRRDASYISANDPRILVGLGNSEEPIDVTVMWSNGKINTYSSQPINTYHTYIQ